MELLQALGIEPKLLLAQVVNFSILLLILWKVAYKPLLALMRDRSLRIERSLKDAQAIDRQKEELEVEREQVLSEARTQAQAIVVAAKQNGEELIAKAKDEARIQAQAILARAEVDAKAARAESEREARQSMGSFVASIAKRFFQKTIGTKEDEALIQTLLKDSK